MKVLVTGAAGFIGFFLVERLLSRGDTVIGIDNINDYYDISLKYARLNESGIEKDRIEWYKEVKSIKHPLYHFIRMNLEDRDQLHTLCEKEQFDVIVNLAAQAGVRYSIINPYAYIQSNVVGFLNILEAARNNKTKHLVYASSSSVYGLNTKMPFSVKDNVDHPVSLYAATKKSNELMAHTYSHLYQIPTTGLRFFTVYGPWGRPDMAYFLFSEAISKGKPIPVFNHGKMKRDFTYIDDIISGIVKVADAPPNAHKNQPPSDDILPFSNAPYAVYNIGNNQPVELMSFIKELENNLNKEAVFEMLDMQPGDVPATWADVDDLITNFGYSPDTTIQKGITEFVKWYSSFNGQNQEVI